MWKDCCLLRDYSFIPDPGGGGGGGGGYSGVVVGGGEGVEGGGVESLHVGIAISGWLNTDADDSFKLPWINLMLSKEQYALKWEGRDGFRKGGHCGLKQTRIKT